MQLDSKKLIPTRYSLLSRLQNWEDHESWKNFFDTYWQLIYGVAIKSGLNDAEAQDVVQETILCVARDISKFKRDPGLGSFKGWLKNITRWRIADQLRKQLRPKPADTHLEPSPAAEQIPDPHADYLEQIWEEEWKENLLAAGLERVKKLVREEQYQLFDLYALKKWPVGKVANALQVSPARVYLAKHRVSKLLKKELQRLENNPY